MHTTIFTFVPMKSSGNFLIVVNKYGGPLNCTLWHIEVHVSWSGENHFICRNISDFGPLLSIFHNPCIFGFMSTHAP